MNPRLVSSVVVCAFVLGCSTGETGETRGSETGAATDMPSTTATSDTDDGGSTGSTGASTGEVTSGETGGDSSTGDETGDETTGEPLACWELPGPWHLGWEIPAPTPIDGDPVDGEWALLNEDYVSCGVPYDLFQLGKVFLGTYADGEQLAWREGKNANLPYNWNVVYSEGGTEHRGDELPHLSRGQVQR